MKPKPQIVHDGPNRVRLVNQKYVSCPGYILRSNKQGFTWKQVCSCCPRGPAHQYHLSELRVAA